MKPGPRSLWAIFAAPIAIGVASVVGLVVALTGDGLRDVASWLALAVPVAATAWALRARRR
ncbi:hypothetical protein [Phenylobacterium sp.]|uniref:hypothetical protein n=1 Tax=Phenylobacterium sp. TaxID=1871053 RepID=UPI00301E5F5B